MPTLDPTRKFRVTASRIPFLMSGSPDAVNRMWLQTIDDQRQEADPFGKDDWTGPLALLIEPFAMDYHATKTGHQIIERGQQFFHPARDYVSSTQDGYRPFDDCVIDCKVTNPFREYEETAAFYSGQMVAQMECRGAANAALLIVRGGARPAEIPVYITDEYRAKVWDVVDRFWDCVTSLTPPHPLHFPRIVPPSQWKRIDLDSDLELPNWSGEMRELLLRWNFTYDAARDHEESKQQIKSLIADDIGEIVCGSYRIRRDRRNAISIRRKGDEV